MASITERLQEQKVELPPESVLRQQVLERLVRAGAARCSAPTGAGLKVPDEALNEAMAEVAQRNQIPLSQLPEVLAVAGRRLRVLS